MRYKFSSLAGVADWLENRAREKRASMVSVKPQRARDLKVEASTYENIADLLRNTDIEG